MNEWSRMTDSLNTANPQIIAQYIKTELEIRIENALGIGQENAIKMRELQQKIGAKSNRKVRLAIENMRLHNVGILSDSTHGYWIGKDFAEYESWITFMLSYLKATSHMVSTVRKYAEDNFHQQYQLPLFLMDK